MRQGAGAPPAVGARKLGREGYRSAELAVRIRWPGIAVELRLSRDDVTVLVGASNRYCAARASTGSHTRRDVVGR